MLQHNPAVDDAKRLEGLTQYKVTYVFYGDEEKALGAYDPSNAPFLTLVYDQDGVKVFKVKSA